MGKSGRIGRAAASIALLASLFAALPARAADKAADKEEWIYLQRTDDGLRSYTDSRPLRGAYSKIRVHGRATASASCLGLTPASMQARARTYEPFIRAHAEANNLPPALVSAVMRVESCYDRHAVSRDGARGLMQLMPETARRLGVIDSFDAEQNIAGGVRFLAQMMKRFKNDVRLGLAAYNAGPEAVEAYHDVPPFPETKSYVARILKLYQG